MIKHLKRTNKHGEYYYVGTTQIRIPNYFEEIFVKMLAEKGITCKGFAHLILTVLQRVAEEYSSSKKQ